MRELETAAQNYACFLNDLFSYQKEVQFDGEIHDMVLVVEDFLDVDRMTARDVVAELMGARMEQFENIVATGLPALFEDAQLDENAQKSLTRHADDLKECMSGILEWHRRCPRYIEAELIRMRTPQGAAGFSFLPTGPGTSALRPLELGPAVG
jgi:germacradienol/geosmin synthase